MYHVFIQLGIVCCQISPELVHLTPDTMHIHSIRATQSSGMDCVVRYGHMDKPTKPTRSTHLGCKGIFLLNLFVRVSNATYRLRNGYLLELKLVSILLQGNLPYTFFIHKITYSMLSNSTYAKHTKTMHCVSGR